MVDSVGADPPERQNLIDSRPLHLAETDTTDVDPTEFASEDVPAEATSVEASAKATSINTSACTNNLLRCTPAHHDFGLENTLRVVEGVPKPHMASSVSITLPADGAVVSVDPLQRPSCIERLQSPLGDGESTRVDSAEAMCVDGASVEAACVTDLADVQNCASQLEYVELGEVDIAKSNTATTVGVEAIKAMVDSVGADPPERQNLIDSRPLHLAETDTTDVDPTEFASEDVPAEATSVEASAKATSINTSACTNNLLRCTPAHHDFGLENTLRVVEGVPKPHMASSVSITLPADGAVVSVDPLQRPSCIERLQSPLGDGESTRVDSAEAMCVNGASVEAACVTDLADVQNCASQLEYVELG